MNATEANRVLITDFANLFYKERDVRKAFEKYVAPDYRQHNPNAIDGRDAAVAMLTPMLAKPGARFDIQRIIVDGDMAVVHLHGRPDIRTKGVAVADIYRISNGKIVEHWDVIQPLPNNTVNPHPMF